ncbi:ABC transporter permease [Candidatus Riflebacteria bacterium]
MRKTLGAKFGDSVTIKWRDAKGVFDAADFHIVEIMDTFNPRVDENVIWISLTNLRKMFLLQDKISYVVLKNESVLKEIKNIDANWAIRDRKNLTAWISDIIKAKKKGQKFLFAILLFLCAVGIFNAQVLSVFKRKKEIGTLMALGLHKTKIVILFTLEGFISMTMATIAAMFLGTPIFYWTATSGFPVAHAEGSGLPIGDRLYAHYSPELILQSLFFIFLVMTLVSWFPTRSITRMEPAKALSGRK